MCIRDSRLVWNDDMANFTNNVKLIWDELNEYGESVKEDGIDVTAQLFKTAILLNANNSNDTVSYTHLFSGDYQSEAAIKVTASADGSITFRALCPCLDVYKRQSLPRQPKIWISSPKVLSPFRSF